MSILRYSLLIVSIIVLLALMRISILLFPFRYYAKRLSIIFNSPCRLSYAKQLGYARLIGRSIAIVSRYTPWQSKCLVQALVAKLLLRRFKIENILVIGVNFDKGTDFIAHAWVDVASTTMVGGTDNKQYKAIKSFADTYKV